MFIGASGQEFAFGGHEVHRQQVVDRQAVLAHEPAEPATEREPGDARVGDDTAGRGEAELGFRYRIRPRSPAWASAVDLAGSTFMPFIRERSMTRPPSQVPYPAAWCAPLLTAISRSCSRAKATEAMTSATPRQRAMSAGRRSILPFHTRRAWS